MKSTRNNKLYRPPLKSNIFTNLIHGPERFEVCHKSVLICRHEHILENIAFFGAIGLYEGRA